MNISEYDDDDIPNYKIIIVGRTQSGKTKFLTRYKFGSYNDDGVTTMGVDSLLIKTPKAKFSYYDTAGQ
jgi:GTPase SAR1 family protein